MLHVLAMRSARSGLLRYVLGSGGITSSLGRVLDAGNGGVRSRVRLLRIEIRICNNHSRLRTFNLLGVLGITAVAQGGIAVPAAALHFDFPVMFAATLACLPVFLTGHRVSRWEGAILLAYYAAYVSWLVMAASEHVLRDAFGVALFAFALPLTAVGLIASLIAARRRRA